MKSAVDCARVKHEAILRFTESAHLSWHLLSYLYEACWQCPILIRPKMPSARAAYTPGLERSQPGCLAAVRDFRCCEPGGLSGFERLRSIQALSSVRSAVPWIAPFWTLTISEAKGPRHIQVTSSAPLSAEDGSPTGTGVPCVLLSKTFRWNASCYFMSPSPRGNHWYTSGT